MPDFKKKKKGFNMKNLGDFDFGNKGNFDIKTKTKDQSVVEANKSTGKKSVFELTEKGKKAIMASDANPNFKKAIAGSPVEMKYGSPMDMYGGKKGSMATFKSDAQRKAAYASGYKGKGK